MAQYIKQGNIFGRIGTGIGKGLADQVPKEIENYRLRTGLKNLADQADKGDLSQAQFLAQAAGTYGATPQMIQSFGELAKQQSRGKSLSEMYGKNEHFINFPDQKISNIQQNRSDVPSITKGSLLEKIQEGYKIRSEDEKFKAAGEKYNSNPSFYGNDPQKAIDMENQIDQTEEKKFLADKAQYDRLTDIQNKVVERLKNQSERLNTKVPSELYSKIENQAILATKPRSEGGRGISEQQAMKEYGDALNDASRQFEKINQLSSWGVSLKPASETLRSIKQIQEEMEKLGETDNAAYQFVKSSKVSPQFAFAAFEPVKRVPELSSEIKKLKTLTPVDTIFETKVPISVSVPKTLEISPKLAEFVKNNEKASPLAISYEIEKKGYDAPTFLKYLNDHAKELNLRSRQSEQASTSLNTTSTWNDWWLSSFSGLE